MTPKTKKKMRDVMLLAWGIVKQNKYTISHALKIAWRNFKLKAKMRNGIVKFFFKKVDGTIREAHGTLMTSYFGPFSDEPRKKNNTVSTYWDVDKNSWRCFKIINLLTF